MNRMKPMISLIRTHRFVVSVFALCAASLGELRSQNDATRRIQVNSQDTWRDKSPHKAGFAAISGIMLHYLDWGGKGETLLFLTGLGSCAHIYDDLAPKFTDRFRVLGLTRRGHGESDRPEIGYDTATLVEDVRQFLQVMKVERTVLVGHSIAGDELTMFAGKYPQYVSKLVYLDAAWDRSPSTPIWEIEKRLVALIEPFPGGSTDSYDARRAWRQKLHRAQSEATEADMRVMNSRSKSEKMSLGKATAAVKKGTVVPDYSTIKIPTLSIYADDYFPELILDENREKAKPVLAETRQFREFEREKFRLGVPHARIIVMPDTSHYCFIHREAEVVREMRSFLMSN